MNPDVATRNSKDIDGDDSCYTPERKNECIGWSICGLIICVILALILIPYCFHYVHYDKFGFIRNVYGGVDYSTVVSQGRYFLTLNQDLVLFPTTYQRIGTQLSIFTDTGLPFYIDIVFYYKL